jgi:hypothetical protein
MTLAVNVLLEAIFSAKRLEQLQADVREMMIKRLLEDNDGYVQRAVGTDGVEQGATGPGHEGGLG